MAGSPEVLANPGAGSKRPAVMVGIVLAVVVVVGGAYAGSKFFGRHAAPGAAQAAPVAVQHRAAAPAVPAASPAATAKSGPSVAQVATPASAPAVARKGAHTVAAQTASTAGSEAPVVTAVPQNAAPTGPAQVHLDDHVTYQYNALGRRDPFQSLVGGQFVGADEGGDAPPDPGGIKVVGIVWGADDQFALVEDVRGNSFVLRKGDKVQNGIVEGLRRDAVIVNITAEGQSQSVVIPLVRKGDQNAR